MTEKSALEDQLYQKQIDEEDLRQEMQSLQEERERLQSALQSLQEASEKVCISCAFWANSLVDHILAMLIQERTEIEGRIIK